MRRDVLIGGLAWGQIRVAGGGGKGIQVKVL